MKKFFDPTMPGLVTALDTNIVLEMLQRALIGHGIALDLIELKIYYVLYNPGVHCRFLYKLKFLNPQTGRIARQLLSAQILRIDESEPSLPRGLLNRYETYGKKAKVIPTPMLYLPQVRMVIYAFPVDTSLPWLFDVIDSTSLKVYLKSSWPQQMMRVHRVNVQLLGYTPQSRASFLYKVQGEVKDTRVPEVRRIIGKIHAYKQAAKRFADAWALGKAAQGRVRLATPMGYIASSNLSLQEEVRGIRLSEFVGSNSFVDMMRHTARAIASFHGLSLPLSTLRTPQKEAGVVHRWANLLTTICPDQARRVEQLRNRLVAEIEACVQMGAPVHGDFHHSNILVDGDNITLIDLDELAYGDPLLDVGRLLASVRIPALRILGSPSGLAEAQEAFLAEYLTMAPGNEKRARLFEAVSLMVSAATPFRLQRPGWESQTAMLLDEAELVLRKVGSISISNVDNMVSNQSIPFEDCMQWARDEAYMLALFDPHIRETYGAELITCRVTSERKTERSYHIRYALSGWCQGGKWKLCVRGIVRKASARSLFQRIESLHLAIAGHPDALTLPRPIAFLSPLSMLILEEPQGIRFSSLIGTPAALDVARKLGRALALFHHTRLEMIKSSSVEEEISALHRRIKRLKAVTPDLYSQAESLLTQIDRQSRAIPARLTPILRTLHPHHVLCVGDRVAFAELEEVTLSHPLIDVGNFLARLTFMGIRKGNIVEVAELADSFCHAYIIAGGVSGDGTALFEASALIRLACLQVEQDSTEENAARLIECAVSRLNML